MLKAPVKKIFRIMAWTLGSVAGLVLGALVFLSLWLTPERLGTLVSGFASEYLEADTRIGSIDVSVWSTFPTIEVSVDDAAVVSRRMRRLPDSVRAVLPADADTLVTFRSFRGAVNPFALLGGRVSVRSVEADALRLNLVALNDSVNNYDIVPPGEEKKEESELPHISVGSLRLTNPRPITYYSAADNAAARIEMSQAGLLERRQDTYDLTLKGKLWFSADRLRVLEGFPFCFSGNLKMAFKPLKITLERYGITLGNVQSHIDLDMQLSGKDLGVTALTCDISPFQLLRLFAYLPASMLPDLTGLESDMVVKGSVRLTEPYRFSSSSLPSLEVKMEVPDSYMRYTLSGIGTLDINRIGMAARLDFNGTDVNASRLFLDRFEVSGEGMMIQMSGTVDSLMGNPRVEADLKAAADLTHVMPYMHLPAGMTIGGRFRCDVNSRFTVADIMEPRPASIYLEGTADLLGFHYSDAAGTRVDSRTARLVFGSHVRKAGSYSLDAGMLALQGTADTVTFTMPDMRLRAGGISFTGGSTRDMLTSRIGKGMPVLPFGMEIGARSLYAFTVADSMTVNARSIRLNGAVQRYENKADVPKFITGLHVGTLLYRDPLTYGRFQDLQGNLTMHLNPVKPGKSRYQQRYDSIAARNPGLSPDSIARLARRKRPPRTAVQQASTLSLTLDRPLRRLIRQWDMSGSIKVVSGAFATYIYPALTLLNGLDMDFTLDRINLHNVSLHSQDNGLRLQGSISNLRQLMLGGRRTPVVVRLDAHADTININQMAATYAAGQRLEYSITHGGAAPPPDLLAVKEAGAATLSPQDTIPILVPRNLDAEIQISADRSMYTNLHIYDIAAMIMVKQGALNVDSLRARTDFGSAYLNLIYSTRDIDDINASIDLGFDRIDVVTFFQRFHTLLEMMPDMANLSGYVSAKVAGSVNLFPTMDLNLPSLKAVIDVRGSGLSVTQDAFIRKVARMLLIRKKGPLIIDDMIVQASIHDNMIELYPFIFQCERYKLGLLGENDFNGNMYYHVSVLRSPIPFRFGINIYGTFDKYKIRFGGAKYKPDQAVRIMHLVDDKRINLVQQMKGFMAEFIRKAAMSNVPSPGNDLLKRGDKNPAGGGDAESLFPEGPIRALLKNKESIKAAADKKTQDEAAAKNKKGKRK